MGKDAKYKDEDWLREKYIEEKNTTYEIADATGVSDVTIGNWLERHGIPRRPKGHLTKPAEDRFWEYVDKGGEGECWEWTGWTGHGYGYFGVGGKDKRSHRLAFLFCRGDPGDKLVLHTCDNRQCVNPNHLYLGTHEDNIADAIERDRLARGEKNAASKLSEGEVAEMRRRYSDESVSQTELGDEYGVSQTTVSKIVRGETWSHVEGKG